VRRRWEGGQVAPLSEGGESSKTCREDQRLWGRLTADRKERGTSGRASLSCQGGLVSSEHEKERDGADQSGKVEGKWTS